MASQPQRTAPSPVTGEELDEAVTLAHEWGHLKRLPRTGWLHAARDADKLGMLLQTLDYRRQGYSNTERFIQTAAAALRTESGRPLGEAALRVDPAVWRHPFARPASPAEHQSSNGQ